jgi:hypothetical protein
MTRIRWGALALGLAGVMFVLYPVTRPWHDESTQDGLVAALTSGAWVASHFFAMLGFVLVPLGLLSLFGAVAHTRAASTALAAVVVTWLGAGLTLPYYGAEDFGLSSVATFTADGPPIDLVALKDERFGPLAITTFGLGLLLLAIGAVLAAVAVARSSVFGRFTGALFALGFVLFLPQFFGPPAVRIAHGVLLGIGCAWLALALWRAPATTVRPAAAA